MEHCGETLGALFGSQSRTCDVSGRASSRVTIGCAPRLQGLILDSHYQRVETRRAALLRHAPAFSSVSSSNNTRHVEPQAPKPIFNPATTCPSTTSVRGAQLPGLAALSSCSCLVCSLLAASDPQLFLRRARSWVGRWAHLMMTFSSKS